MDPVSLALSFFMQNPAMVGSAYQRAMQPGSVDVTQMQVSVADLARGVLQCYHRSARFRSTDVVAAHWPPQNQYGADNSAVFRINYQGITGQPYQMVVAVMARQNSVRTAVLGDNALVPYNKRCQLEEWTS
jgi:hypothetical protein